MSSMGEGANTLWQGLRELVDEHRGADADERWALSELRLNLEAGPEKLLKSAPGTHFTVSCMCIDRSETKALLLRHKKLGKLLQPGGHLEPGDTSLATAAMREVSEEALPPGSTRGLVMLGSEIFDVDAHDIPGNAKMGAHRHLDVRFLARLPEGYEPWFNPEEATEAVFVDLGELARTSEDRGMRRMARKALAVAESRLQARSSRPAP